MATTTEGRNAPRAGQETTPMTMLPTLHQCLFALAVLLAWFLASIPVALVVARAIALMGYSSGVPEGEYRDRAEVKS